jgi:polyhydroxyalkanoate synthesis regulator phasin
MKKIKFRKAATIATGMLVILTLNARAQAQPAPSENPLLDTLIKKGILTEDEAKKLKLRRSRSKPIR